MKIGDISLDIVSDGRFKLDGGAMFGIVPKPLWERLSPADSRNRIQLSLNPLLIRSEGVNILVDTGIGNKHDHKFRDMYAIEHDWTLIKSLDRLGVKPADINYVVPTHMHFDHMGGATLAHAGSIEPAFPKAVFIIQRAEWENARLQNPRNKGSYLEDDYLVLERRGQIKLADGDCEVAPGVNVIKTGGHTPGHQIVKITSNGQTAVYAGDLIPTKSHIRPAWCMGYDLFPLEVASWKESFLKEAAENDWTLVFDHETSTAMVKIRKTPKGYEPVGVA